MNKTYENQLVWIIGASSGIGHALAIELDRWGARLILSARNEPALEMLNQSLKNKHFIAPLDISNQDEVKTQWQKITSHHDKIDRVIFLSALYEPGPLRHQDLSKILTMLDVNLKGAFILLHHLLPYFNSQTYGQIALCGSVAGYSGLPNGQPYSATKAAIMNLAQTLYNEEKDIDIKLISPGFVQTPLTDKNNFSMPMMITADEAAHCIAKGLLTNRFEIHFPKKFTLFVKFLSLLPHRLYFALTKNI